jgi:toxin YoeB
LKLELSGCWSRRIDQEHRLVYKVEKSEITILACRYHYG